MTASSVMDLPDDHLTISPPVLYFGTPVVLVVTRNEDGTSNITPMSSAWALGSCVVLGLSTAGHGAANLRRERECTLNFASAELWPKVEKIARGTGRDPVPAFKHAIGYSYMGDKFAAGGFTAVSSERVRAPRISECPLQFEARLVAIHGDAVDLGSTPQKALIIECEVVRVHAHRGIVVPGTDHIDTQKWNPLYYVFRHYFGDARDLGRTFRAEI
ncbi:conserved hypothetical protein [Bradyrhizobium sp. STM 3843]|uniref:flavin reductase family protein n=1 Tax=Bradyrhizobium sp. STM 3843 TaxID=551947 RepID=UPI000240375D|nr:flavin reductase family protein [Bradyrhizobium sp. STM 3843]CCE11448.1 conserved hypothetical protein [Bradyrhizobium sp. STM 3843]